LDFHLKPLKLPLGADNLKVFSMLIKKEGDWV